jgi:hypothetical protein
MTDRRTAAIYKYTPRYLFRRDRMHRFGFGFLDGTTFTAEQPGLQPVEIKIDHGRRIERHRTNEAFTEHADNDLDDDWRRRDRRGLAAQRGLKRLGDLPISFDA